MNPRASSSRQQMTLDFEPGLTDRHVSLLGCVREVAYTQRQPLKTIAAEMDLSLSDLSRKLAANPDDSRRFSVDDLERFLAVTGDMTPIYWLIERYLEDADVRQRRALTELSKMMPQIAALLKQAGGT